MPEIPYFTKFDQMTGPDVSYPANQDQPAGPEILWNGEMDPSVQSPHNMDKNMLDNGVQFNTTWDQPFYGQEPGSDLI